MSPLLRFILLLVRWFYRSVFLAVVLNVILSVIQEFLATGNLPTANDLTHSFLIRIAIHYAEKQLLVSLVTGILLTCILVTGFLMDIFGVKISPDQVDQELPEAARIDWGLAVDKPFFLDRKHPLTQVRRWVVVERCRLVAVLGIGGVGKSQFTNVLVRHYLANQFDFIFWRSLEGGPKVSHILQQCIKHFSGQRQVQVPDDPEEQLLLLLKYFREYRCLLVLDNFESVLESGGDTRSAAPVTGDSAAYDTLLRRMGEASHQSCLIITSREKPERVALLEGTISSVHSITLTGLADEDGQRLFENRGLTATNDEWHALTNHYSGNPTALTFVAVSIAGPPFSGSVARYLAQGDTMPDGVVGLIKSQLHDLSRQQRTVLFWLAIQQEATPVDQIRQNLLMGGENVVNSLAVLQYRFLVENAGNGQVTLLPVVREYLLQHLVDLVDEELESGQFDLMDSHALIQSQAKEYIRQRQEHDIIRPLLTRLVGRRNTQGTAALLWERLLAIRADPQHWRGYAAGNLVNLLIHLGLDLRGADLSGIVLRQVDLRNVSLPAVNLADADVATTVFKEAFSTIQAVAFSPDMAYFAGGTYHGEIRVWRTNDGSLQRSFQGHVGFVRALAFSPDGRRLASAGDDKTVRLWSFTADQNNMEIIFKGDTGIVWSIAFSPDGSLLVSGSDDHMVRIWDTITGENLQVLHGHSSRVWDVAFHPSGKQVASGSDDHDIRLWSVRSGRCTRRLRGYTTSVFGLAFNRSGTMLAAARDEGQVQLWNMRTGRVVKQLEGHSDWVRDVVFSHSDTMLASGSGDQTVRIWDVASGKCLKTLTGHEGWVYSPQFSRDDSTLLTSGDDRTVRLWDTHSGECIRKWVGYMDSVMTIAFSPNSMTLAVGRNDNTVQVWDVGLGLPIRKLAGHIDWITSVAFNPAGDILASASEDFTVRLWSLPDGDLRATLTGHENRIVALAFSPDGSLLASASDDHSIRLWQMPSGTSIRALDGHDDEVYCVAFHPHGGLLASGSADETIRVWDLNHDTTPLVLTGHDSYVYCVAFSANGQWLASASEDGTIRLWEVAALSGSSGSVGTACRAVLTAHTGAVNAIAFHPDSTLLASGGTDRIVNVWEIPSGICMATLEGHAQRVNALAFDQPGRLLASGSDDGTIHLWSADTFESMNVLVVERPYEGMRIARAMGLSPAQVKELCVLGAIEA